jgi:hypothetical protein
LGADTILSAWLYRTTRFAAADALKSQRRRQRREQEANMQSTLLSDQTDAAWQQLAPLLDDAMAKLGERDRTALVLRYFDNKTAPEIVAALQVTEDAAQKRVTRALEKLRGLFAKRGVTLSATLIAGAVAANSVSAAPVEMAVKFSVVAAKGAATATSITTIINGTLKIMAWTKAKTIIVVTVGVLLATGATTTIIVARQAAPLLPEKPMPNPNGWNELIRAGDMVSADSGNFPPVNKIQLHNTATANAEALALARAALSNACRVPVQFTEAYAERHFNDLAAIKKLAQAFLTEGKWAESQNRQRDAAAAYLDVIHLGTQSGQGGVLIDELVAIAVESQGSVHLNPLADKLDGDACRKIARTLEAFAAQRQTWAEYRQQEANWSQRTFPGLRWDFMRLMGRKAMAANLRNAEQKLKKHELEMQQLIVTFATRAYELDKGHPLANPADLSPDYLDSRTLNPLANTNAITLPK